MSLVEDLQETAPAEQAAGARRTLAQRLAQRNRLRAERATFTRKALGFSVAVCGDHHHGKFGVD